MSYLVIARKYRPQRFEDVVGQEHITQTLINAIRQNRLAHAYLFCGPRGTGKTTIARIFAKCLRCKNAPTVEPCNECTECLAIMAGNSLDMLEFDAASNTQVEKIREIIIDHVKYAPSTGKLKLYLIDEVHMLSNSSFNALLKTLEEPPEHVKFMFATTDPEKLPATILSRCQRFDFRRIPAALIVKHLRRIAELEGVQIDDAALFAIARGADGAMRDAESALDQLISFCGEEIQEADVLSMFGLTARSQILDMARAILEGNAEKALRDLDQLAHHGKDLGRLLSDLLNHFRNLLLFQISGGDLNLLQVSETEAASLRAQSDIVGADALMRIVEVLADAEARLKEAASKRISFEVTLLKAIEARNMVSIDAVLGQLRQLRDQGRAATPPLGQDNREPSVSRRGSSSKEYASVAAEAPKPGNTTSVDLPAQSAPAALHEGPKPSPVAKGPLPRESLVELWGKMLEAVGRASPFTRTYLLEAHPVSLQNGLLTIGFDPQFEAHIDLVDNSRNHMLLQTKLHELGHPGVQVKFVKAEAPADWAALRARFAQPAASGQESRTAGSGSRTGERPDTAPLTVAGFKDDPLIKKALEIFKGQIVEVRA